MKAVIESVDVINNDVLEDQFDRENSFFESQYKGLNENFHESYFTDAQRFYLNNLFGRFVLMFFL